MEGVWALNAKSKSVPFRNGLDEDSWNLYKYQNGLNFTGWPITDAAREDLFDDVTLGPGDVFGYIFGRNSKAFDVAGFGGTINSTEFSVKVEPGWNMRWNI